MYTIKRVSQVKLNPVTTHTNARAHNVKAQY